MDKSIKKQIRT